MTRRFTANVWHTDSAGIQTFYEMGAPVPDGLPVGDHCWTDVEDGYLAHTGPVPPADADPASVAFDLIYPASAEETTVPERPAFTPPPRSGPGATKSAWQDYWQVTQNSIPPRNFVRDDLIAELRKRDVPVGD